MNKCSLSLHRTNVQNFMARLKRYRKILNPPIIKGYRPYGPDLPKESKEYVTLLFEEYEALRLCDYDGCTHIEAAQIMNISRPTFTRIYSSLRCKLAKAFIEGRPIDIEGGKVYFDSDWYHCDNCNCDFNHPFKEKKAESCPLCSSKNIINHLNNSDDGLHNTAVNNNGVKCRLCGSVILQNIDAHCKSLICPSCGHVSFSKMRRFGKHKSRNI